MPGTMILPGEDAYVLKYIKAYVNCLIVVNWTDVCHIL